MLKSKNVNRDYFNPLVLYNPKLSAGRLNFLWGWLIYPTLIGIIFALLVGLIEIGVLETLFGYYGYSPVYGAFYIHWVILFVIGHFLIQIRRLKDMGKSGWFVLMGLIPIVFIFYFLWLLFSKGEGESSPFFTNINSQKCPYCNSPTPDDATECIYCTAKLNNVQTSITFKNHQKQSRRKNLIFVAGLVSSLLICNIAIV